MGDRALVQFVCKNSEGEVIIYSPTVYLHHHGFMARELIAECYEYMKINRLGDVDYACSRFIGICHTRIVGNTGLGVWNSNGVLTNNDSRGDHGCFIVDVSDFSYVNLM